MISLTFASLFGFEPGRTNMEAPPCNVKQGNYGLTISPPSTVVTIFTFSIATGSM